MAEQDYQKKGKALTGLSAALIVYSLAGGSISNSGNLIGTAFNVENPTVVEGAIILLLIYLAYRYWMILPKPFEELDKSNKFNVQYNKFFQNYIEKLKNEKLKEYQLANPKYNKADMVDIHPSNRTNYIDKDGGGYYIRLEFRMGPEFVTTRVYQISEWQYYLCSLLTFFYTEDFLVIMLPWLLFIAALLLITLSNFGIDVVIN